MTTLEQFNNLYNRILHTEQCVPSAHCDKCFTNFQKKDLLPGLYCFDNCDGIRGIVLASPSEDNLVVVMEEEELSVCHEKAKPNSADFAVEIFDIFVSIGEIVSFEAVLDDTNYYKDKRFNLKHYKANNHAR